MTERLDRRESVSDESEKAERYEPGAWCLVLGAWCLVLMVAACVHALSFTGIRATKQVPVSTDELTDNVPPCPLTICEQI